MWAVYTEDPNALTMPDLIKNYARVGALITLSVAQPIEMPAGVATKEVTENLDGRWNESTQLFEPKPPVRFIDVSALFARFTAQEQIAYFTNQNIESVKHALLMWAIMRSRVNLDSQILSDLLGVLVNQGVITAQRKIEILA